MHHDKAEGMTWEMTYVVKTMGKHNEAHNTLREVQLTT